MGNDLGLTAAGLRTGGYQCVANVPQGGNGGSGGTLYSRMAPKEFLYHLGQQGIPM